MTTLNVALAVGDRFWLEDCDYAYTALRIQVCGDDPECFYVTTSMDEPPMLVCAEDVVEILRG